MYFIRSFILYAQHNYVYTPEVVIEKSFEILKISSKLTRIKEMSLSNNCAKSSCVKLISEKIISNKDVGG